MGGTPLSTILGTPDQQYDGTPKIHCIQPPWLNWRPFNHVCCFIKCSCSAKLKAMQCLYCVMFYIWGLADQILFGIRCIICWFHSLMVLYQLLKWLNWKNERVHFAMLEKIRKRRGSTIQEVALEGRNLPRRRCYRGPLPLLHWLFE